MIVPRPDSRFLVKVLVDYIELRRWCQIEDNDTNAPALKHPEISRLDVESVLAALAAPASDPCVDWPPVGLFNKLDLLDKLTQLIRQDVERERTMPAREAQ